MLLLLLLFSIILIVWLTTRLKVHPFLSLLLAAILYGLLAQMPVNKIVTSIQEGFGNTLGSIGPVIILGVMIGAILEHSGAAYKLAEFVIRLTGTKLVSTAMASIGFIISIPVFADSGFIILSPLNKAMTKKAGKSVTITATALSIGLMSSHCLVPPTPGPVAVAGILEVDMGLLIFWGIIIGILALVPVIIFVELSASKIFVDPNPEQTEEALQLQAQQAPGPAISILPVLVPIVLIVFKSFNEYSGIIQEEPFLSFVSFTGSPVIALLIGLAFSLLLPRKIDASLLSAGGQLANPLKEAAVIILITGAGGIFGKMLQNSGIAETIGALMGDIKMGIWLPFLIAAALKTAQGSSTVSMITTASIMAPMMTQLGFTTELSKVFVALSIGAGSTIMSHVNDSFFWIVTQLNGMSVSTGFRTHGLGSIVLGVSAGLLVFLASLIFG